MATITEKSKGNKVVSFKFHCCVGRDEQGKQHFRTTTWKPPEGLSYAKARKMAEAEAYRWEQTIKGNAEGQGVYTSPLPAPCEAVQTAEEVPLPILRRTGLDAFEGHCGRCAPLHHCYVCFYDACLPAEAG